MRHDDGILPDPAMERIRTLEEKFKAIKVHSTPSLDVVDMFLVSGLIIPKKFKVPDFDKYKGGSYPYTHLRVYRCKMVAYTDNNKLVIHHFQDSLIGASLE